MHLGPALLLLLPGTLSSCTPPAEAAQCDALIDYALVVDNSASVLNETAAITQFLQAFVANFDVASGFVKFSVRVSPAATSPIIPRRRAARANHSRQAQALPPAPDAPSLARTRASGDLLRLFGGAPHAAD